MSEKPPLRPVDDPLPPYSMGELRGDLHHLIQPIIGGMRVDNQYAADPAREHIIERLYLALALADVAAGHQPINDTDVRMARTRHGVGYFRNEEGPVRDKIQQAASEQRRLASTAPDGPS